MLRRQLLSTKNQATPMHPLVLLAVASDLATELGGLVPLGAAGSQSNTWDLRVPLKITAILL
jgi:hypothetical protein